MTNPEHVDIVKQGVEAIRRWRQENPDTRLDLGGVEPRGPDPDMADLRGADLPRADLRGADLHGANLRGAELRGADLHGADMYGVNLWEANLWEANLYEVRGAEHAHYLETVRFIPVAGIQALGSDNDALHFEECQRPWPERIVDWEQVKRAGRLPLFGISYTALILIPLVFYALAFYNDKIELVRAWAEQAVSLPEHPLHRLAPLLQERLHPRPIPRQSFLLLVSTILLAVASTLYTFRCPSRIKEFSRDQWCDQLGRSLLHYWPLAWKHRYLRLVCAACYALGGAGALWVLGTKVWLTALFIWKHSTWPWPWW
jgi:hypothetical protein